MKELFMELLMSLKFFGQITAASLYKSGTFLSIEFEKDDETYTLTVTKERKNEVDK